MKKWIMALTVVAGLALAQNANAQAMGSEYRTALGVKFYPGALTLKHFTGNNRALEGIASFWKHGFRFTGLYEIHGNINGAPGLKWYVGPGAHIGVYNKGWYYRDDRDKYYDDGDMSFGVDGVLGLDYKIKGAPINLSIDWQPYFEIAKYPHFGNWGGFAVRYAF